MEFDLTGAKAARAAIHDQLADFRAGASAGVFSHYLYVLTDPESGDVRYVGQTTGPLDRYTGHIACAKRGPRPGKKWPPVAKWIRSLLEKGQAPEMHVVGIVKSRPFRGRHISGNTMMTAIENDLIDKMARGHQLGAGVQIGDFLNVAGVPKFF